jgi:hypothetical protein
MQAGTENSWESCRHQATPDSDASAGIGPYSVSGIVYRGLQEVVSELAALGLHSRLSSTAMYCTISKPHVKQDDHGTTSMLSIVSTRQTRDYSKRLLDWVQDFRQTMPLTQSSPPGWLGRARIVRNLGTALGSQPHKEHRSSATGPPSFKLPPPSCNSSKIRMLSVLSFLVLCLLHVEDALSLRVPLQPRAVSSQLYPRANATVAVNDLSNTQYIANLTVGGCVIVLLLFDAPTLQLLLVLLSPS